MTEKSATSHGARSGSGFAIRPIVLWLQRSIPVRFATGLPPRPTSSRRRASSTRRDPRTPFLLW